MARKRICFLIALLAFASLAAAQEAGERFVFTPQSTAQAQFAGYYVALEQGFYAEEGLDVTIAHPYTTTSAVDNIREGVCQATILPLSLAMRTIDGGLPLVNAGGGSWGKGLGNAHLAEPAGQLHSCCGPFG